MVVFGGLSLFGEEAIGLASFVSTREGMHIILKNVYLDAVLEAVELEGCRSAGCFHGAEQTMAKSTKPGRGARRVSTHLPAGVGDLATGLADYMIGMVSGQFSPLLAM
jgi:hypothetical protein